MKTTLEIPDTLFRKAKACAASRGVSLKTLVNEALAARLSEGKRRGQPKPWLKVFDGLKRDAAFHDEMARIDAAIEEAFEQIEPEDRA